MLMLEPHRKTVTIFLAGTGESGKSTVVKQLRLKVRDESPSVQALASAASALTCLSLAVFGSICRR